MGWGGVGWGGVITFMFLRTPMMSRHGTSLARAHTRHATHMAVAMRGQCSWKEPVGENGCVLSEDVEITGKSGWR